MDTLTAIRANGTGLFSAPQAVRAVVAKKLAETAAARAGVVTTVVRATAAATPTASPAVSLPSSNAATAATASSTSTASLAQALSSTASTGTSPTTDTLTGQSIDQNTFLKLLVMQMQNQDPTNPMDDTQMVSQLAQFSALEQTTNLNTKMDTLSGNIDQLNFISASQMLGKTVTGVDMKGNPQTGVVQSVQLNGSVVMMDVNGSQMSMAGVQNIATTPAAVTAASGVIAK